jgi:hypothetical protein
MDSDFMIEYVISNVPWLPLYVMVALLILLICSKPIAILIDKIWHTNLTVWVKSHIMR